jgi:hypothetical protein
LKEGDKVIYIDDLKKEHNSLVTSIHSGEKNPSINIVYVGTNESKQDMYGQELERDTSVVHIDDQSAYARCWLRESEK